MSRKIRRYLRSTEFMRRIADLNARMDRGWIPPDGATVAAELGLPPAVLRQAVLAGAAFLRAEMGPERTLN